MAKDIFYDTVKLAPDRILYLAVPKEVHQTFLRFEPAKTVIERYEVRLIVYNPTQEVIEQWIE